MSCHPLHGFRCINHACFPVNNKSQRAIFFPAHYSNRHPHAFISFPAHFSNRHPHALVFFSYSRDAHLIRRKSFRGSFINAIPRKAGEGRKKDDGKKRLLSIYALGQVRLAKKKTRSAARSVVDKVCVHPEQRVYNMQTKLATKRLAVANNNKRELSKVLPRATIERAYQLSLIEGTASRP